MIEIVDLSKNFGSFLAVQKLNLKVDRGSVFGFLGPNGAGKTTTIKMLMGLLVPSSGRAIVENLDCQKDRVQVKKAIGYLPDNPQFPDFLKGREVVQMAGELQFLSRQEAKRKAEILISQFGLEEASEEYSNNYSAGMKKRLGLACALIHDPNVLILDEPTNGLDPHASKLMREWILESAARGKTIFLSTHLLEMAERICTHIGILHKGVLNCAGTMDEVRSQHTDSGNLEELFFSVTLEGKEHESAH